ncbi:MAG: hypothetical protein QM773_17350 [Hyphomonadaceae bacterium]
MSAGATGAVGPVSVRYAAQIRELLFAQAMQRMAAEQEAARAADAAQRAANAEAAKMKEPEPIDAKVEAPKQVGLPAPIKAPEAKPETATTGQLVDIQA